MKSDLYELIHSLNKSEKRYFKIEAAKYTSDKNIYLVVYELLEKQRTYNPQALKRALEKTHPKAVKRLTTTKNYLYTLILKTLNAYYEDKSSVFEFNKRIQQVEILFFKGLYKQAEKILKQAKKIAVKMGLYPQQLLVLKWEYELAFLGNKFQHIVEEVTAIQERQEEVLKALEQVLIYEKTNLKTYDYIFQNGPPKTEEEKQALKACTTFPKEVLPPPSPYTKALFHYIQSTYHYFMGEVNQALVHAKERVEVFEKYPQLIAEDAYSYIKALYNYIQALISLAEPQFDEALYYIDKVKMLKNKKGVFVDKRASQLIFLLAYSHSIKIYMAQGHFEKILDLGEEIKQLKGADRRMVDEDQNSFIVYLKLSFAALVAADYDRAIYWMRLLLNNRMHSVRYDWLGFAKILHLMIHVELENYNLLPSLIDAANRYLTEHEQLGAIERRLLGLFRKMASKGKWDRQLIKYLETTKEMIDDYIRLPENKISYWRQYFMSEWLVHKLTNRSYKSLLVEKLSSD